MFTIDSSLYPGIERLFLTLIAVASVVGLILGATNHLLFVESFSSMVLLFWFWLLATYLGLAIPVVLIIQVLHHYFDNGRVLFAFVNTALVAWLVFLAVVEFPVRAVMEHPFHGAGIVSLLLLLAAGLGGIWYNHDRRRRVRTIYFGALLVFLLTVLVGGTVPSQGTRIDRSGTRRTSPVETPLVLIGLDGADWDYMNPLIERGKLPTLSRLKRKGSWGRLKTIQPTKSPILWTSMATGHPPERHGINGFLGYRIFGSDRLFARPDFPAWTGLSALFPYIVRGTDPLNNSHRRSYAYWEIASSYGQPVSVVNWWMTWPADVIQGAMITERIHYRRFGYTAKPTEARLVYPPGFEEWARRRMTSPANVGYGTWSEYFDLSRKEYRRLRTRKFESHNLVAEFPFLISMLESNTRLSSELIDRLSGKYNRSVDSMVLFRALDLAGHTGLRYSDLVETSNELPRFVRETFGSFYGRIYNRVDQAVGKIIRQYDNPNVVIVSDHGFERRINGGEVKYDHKEAPDGVWIASGPAFENGKRSRLTLYQVIPLVLTAKGLPLAEDFTDQVPVDLFDDGFLRSLNRSSVDTFGTRGTGDERSGRNRTNDRIENHLDGLGYF
ncbi:MAG: alkaline phosphatase family protein [bacterium]